VLPIDVAAVVTPVHRSTSRSLADSESTTRSVLLSTARMPCGLEKSAPPSRKPPSLMPGPVPVEEPSPPPASVLKSPVAGSKTRIRLLDMSAKYKTEVTGSAAMPTT
jgi:hypothetical protein